jgi:inner centromere protein
VTRSTRSKQKLKKKVEEVDDEDPEIPRPIQIKKEKLSLAMEKVAEEPVKRSSRSKTKDSQVEVAPTGPTSPARSEKSVYEDAVSNEGAKPVILLQKLTAADFAEVGTPPPKGDETFVKQPGSANATYNVPQVASSGTPGISDATFDVNTGGSPAIMDGTFDVLPARSGQTPITGDINPKKAPNYNESLMTEDNSQDEDSENECLTKLASKKVSKAAAAPLPGPKSSKGKKNELFNPNIHSPIKRKIEAFEKAAASNVYASPAQLRPKTSRIPSKYNTPNLNLKPKQSTTTTTPTAQQSLNTLMANAQSIKAISSSTSKLAHIQKKQNATTITKSHSLSREPSAEDLRRANASALEEKKKKREEKLRLVHQQKEQIEKEKREQAEKQMREREEKSRKIMEEKELEQAKKKAERKRLEEIKQANLKMQEQARLEQERAEELKQLEELKR